MFFLFPVTIWLVVYKNQTAMILIFFHNICLGVEFRYILHLHIILSSLIILDYIVLFGTNY